MSKQAAIRFGILAIALWPSGCRDANEKPPRHMSTPRAYVTQKQDMQAKLVKAVGDLPVWQMGPDNFTGDQWTLYVQVAQRLQKADPNVVADVLDGFALKPDEDYGLFSRPDSRVLVVLRVMFDLPENADRDQQECSFFLGGWKRPDSLRADLAWPVKWLPGGPRVRPYTGFMGGPYDPAGEYRCFLQHFRFRDLSAFDQPTTKPAP